MWLWSKHENLNSKKSPIHVTCLQVKSHCVMTTYITRFIAEIIARIQVQKNQAISCKSLKPCNLITRCVLINCILFFKLWKVKHLKTIVNKLINFQLHNLHFHQIKLPESLSFTSIAMITTGHISAFPWQLIITKISTTNEKGQTYPEKCLGFADNQLNRITIGFVVVSSDPLWT